MEELSNDLIREILLTQDIHTIKEFCQTCKKVQVICEDDYFWQQLIYAHFGNPGRRIGTSWQNTYQILNTEIFEATRTSRHGRYEMSKSTKIFLSFDSARTHLIHKILEFPYELDCRSKIVKSDLSPAFRLLLDNYFLDEIEDACGDNLDLLADYKTYMKRYKNVLKEELNNGKEVGNEHDTFEIVKQRILI